MIKDNRYSHYTKKELIEELFLMIDNYNGLEWQINNQAKYINQNYILIEWMEKWVRNDPTADPDTFTDMVADWRKENEQDLSNTQCN